MPRRPRVSTGGLAYHVLNRAVGRGRLFDDEADYLAMERVIERTHKRLPVRIVTYCLMPTHWHFVLWPEEDRQLSQFMRLLTVTHTQRRHAHRHTGGTGPLYQGRFKSFPIQQDEHFLTVCRYVERNAVRANLAESAAKWRWGGLAKRAMRQRPPWLMPMLATTIADLDGLSRLAGVQAYWDWHHRACHNLCFGILAAAILAIFSGKTLGPFALYLGLFHLHLDMDVFGSGPGWGIYYLWPFSNWMFDNTHLSWEFYSWQNLSIAGLLLV